MMHIARSCRVAVAGLAVGVVGVLSVAGATASAEPLLPPRPTPAPSPATAPSVPLAPQAAAIASGPVGNTIPGTAAPLPASPALAPARPGMPSVASPPAHPALLPASAGTLRDYFQSKNVNLEPQRPQGFKALDIVLPMPPGWTQIPDPNVPDAFVVTANRSSNSLYTSNAQLVVYRLIGNFDPQEAITHGYVDSQQLAAWRSTDASLADFGGVPSSIIEGTFRQNDMTLNTSRRHVIATSGPDKYLVSLAVTTDATQAVAEAPATDAIINGFRVGAPAPARPVAPPVRTPGAQTMPPSQTLSGLPVASPH